MALYQINPQFAMDLDRAKRSIKTTIKMAMPFGLLRAIQAPRERDRQFERFSDEIARLQGRVQILEGERVQGQEAHKAISDTETEVLAKRAEADHQAFRRNEVIVDGRRIYSKEEAPLIDLQIDGRDNFVQIAQPVGPGTLHVATRPGTVGCRFEFGPGNRVASNVFVSFFHSGGNWAKQSSVVIGAGNLFNGNVHILAGICPSTLVRIGNDNLFADNIQIVGAVEHLTYNVETMARESVESGVRIDDRVWVCKDALIFNRSKIASDNVIAARAVTNRTFGENHTVIAGAPARVAKRGVMWHLNTTDDYLTGAGPLECAGPVAPSSKAGTA